VGYAVSTTLVLLLTGLEALHIVRNIKIDYEQAARLRGEALARGGFLSKLVPPVSLRLQAQMALAGGL
jgi:hypothetical protein